MRANVRIVGDYKFDGWDDEIAGLWSYRRPASDPERFKAQMSFDTARWNAYDMRLNRGLNLIDGERYIYQGTVVGVLVRSDKWTGR